MSGGNTVSGLIVTPDNLQLQEDVYKAAADTLLRQLGRQEKSGKKDVTAVLSGDIVSDFTEELIFAGTHPHLFPTSRGIQVDPNRKKKSYSNRQYARLLFNQHNRLWAQDFFFQFHLIDLWNRKKTLQNAHFSLKANHKLSREDVSPKNLKKLCKLAKEHGPSFIRKTSPEFARIMTNIKIVGTPIAGLKKNKKNTNCVKSPPYKKHTSFSSRQIKNTSVASCSSIPE